MDGGTRYLTYTPWPGQFNNTRMCFETALVLAYLSRRTLVMPREYRREHEPEVDAGEFRPLHPAECFALETLRGIVDLVDRVEYDRRVDGGGGQVDLVVSPGEAVFCYPTIPVSGSPDAERLWDFAAGRRRVLEFTPEMEDCRTLNVESAMLEHFYSFVFFAEAGVEAECKRLIKSHVRFRAPIMSAAAGIAESLGNYCALHVRRNDFFKLYPEQDVPAHRLLGNVMMRIPTGARLYIATDETDRSFFDDLANHYDLCFLDDFKNVWNGDLPAGARACVEQMICALATTFVGTRLSTFSGYITRLRGYHGASDQGSYFTDGSPGSEMDDHGSPRYSWINWVASGYPLWGREFREGWEF